MNIIKPFLGSYPVTQVFGVNRDYYARWGMDGHNGIDYGLPIGRPVLACDGGQAVKGFDPDGYGRYVKITHPWGISLYGHLSQWEGDIRTVKRGQRIGLSGNTGASTGPHLHFEIRVYPIDSQNGYIGRVDPQPYLDKPYQPDIPTIPPIEELEMASDEVVRELTQAIDKLRRAQKWTALGLRVQEKNGAYSIVNKSGRVVKEYGSADAFIGDGWDWLDAEA